jgi:hypothetical protein
LSLISSAMAIQNFGSGENELDELQGQVNLDNIDDLIDQKLDEFESPALQQLGGGGRKVSKAKASFFSALSKKRAAWKLQKTALYKQRNAIRKQIRALWFRHRA